MRLMLGARIQSFRKQNKLSQAELAKRVGISASYLNLIEHDKRAVAGKLLSDIARQLGLRADQLSRGITTDMIERLQQTARRFASEGAFQPAELSQIEQFVTHFPGWAHLLDEQIKAHGAGEKLNELLSDRMSHDPVLAETLHIMLSNITAIRSTSELLTLQGAMADEQRAKFTRNIFQESKRLSATAEKLLLHFDSKISLTEPEATTSPPVSDVTKAEAQPNLPASVRNDETFHHVRQVITAARVIDTHKHHQFDPFAIAAYFELSPRLTFYRLSELEPHDMLPAFGLLEIDNASGVLYRKEIGALRLPSRSGACPRWPIYRALSSPGHPVMMRMHINSGEFVNAFAIAESDERRHIHLPPLTKAVMIYTEMTAPRPDSYVPSVNVGFHCSICARTNCGDRRETYALLSEG